MRLRLHLLRRRPEILCRVLVVAGVEVERHRRLVLRVEAVQRLGRNEHLDRVAIGKDPRSTCLISGCGDQVVADGVAGRVPLPDDACQRRSRSG